MSAEGSNNQQSHKGEVNRQQVLSTAIIAATVLLLYLCYLIAAPFISSLLWALALAVLGAPAFRRIRSRIGSKGMAAAVVTLAIVLIVVVPLTLVGRQSVIEVWKNFEYVQGLIQSGDWRNSFTRHESTALILSWLEEQFSLQGGMQQLASATPRFMSDLLSGSLWALAQMLLTFFVLFFFLRDSDEMLAGVRGLLPLSNSEIDKVFKRIDDTVYATVFGEVLISLITGALGALIFYLLGFQAPLMWGFIMAVFAFLPAIGTWLVWLPASVYLFIDDRWVAGVVLIAWGVVVLNVFTTLLYPKVVGERLRLNTLAVFIAIIGGLAAFGLVGIVVGPLVLSLTIAMFEIWKERLSKV